MTSKQILNKRTIRIAYSLLILAACAGEGIAQSPVIYEEESLESSIPIGSGDSVSSFGNTIVVGHPNDGMGSVVVFQFDGMEWTETTLLASDGESGDSFGQSVSISGDTIIVGANRDDDNGNDSGSAYVFRYDKSNWNETIKLKASDGGIGDSFGASVSIEEDAIVIGAPGADDDSDVNTGCVYVYNFDGTNWNETIIFASDGLANDSFGSCVDISDDRIVVGAPSDDDNGYNSGAVYIFHSVKNNWVQEGKVYGETSWIGSFGVTVSISGNAVIAGSAYTEWGDMYSWDFYEAGVYTYRFDGSLWSLETVLYEESGDNYLYSSKINVSISGDIAMLSFGSIAWGAYPKLYRHLDSGWVEIATIEASGWQNISAHVSTNQAIVCEYSEVNIYRFDTDGLLHVPEEHATIEDAVRRSFDVSEIVLSAGTYTGTGDSVIDTLGKTLTIRSSDGPENTIIDGEGVRRGIACYNEETTGMPQVTIEGLTFTNGSADEGAGLLSAGGTTTISNCNFTLNDAFFGGAVNILDPEAGSSITGTRFEQNTANFGGGVYLNECVNEVPISSCGFYDNMATYGGGIYNLRGFMALDDVRMSGNAAYEGGGIFELESISSISNSWFGANIVDVGGSHINNHVSYSSIANSTFCSPGSDGHITGGWGDLGGNVFSDECDDCNGNGVPDIIEIKLNPSLDCNGNLAIDSCEIKDGSVADCNTNGIPDSCDLVNDPSLDCDANGVIDSCETGDGSADDCNGNGLPDSCDIVDDPSLDCDANGVIDSCETNDGSADDCNGNGLPDSCDIANGTSLDLDTNDIPDECEDCDGNTLPDGMDLADCDGSPWCSDCNANGELDVCDIASGESNDVNENGIPDICECLEDINGDFLVNVADVLAVIADWDSTANVPADVNNDGIVDVQDLLAIVAAWGACE